MKEHRQLRKFWSFLLAFAMVFTTAVGNIGPVVMAADDDTFVEVTVPNGDFESGETAWTFTGDIQGSGLLLEIISKCCDDKQPNHHV